MADNVMIQKVLLIAILGAIWISFLASIRKTSKMQEKIRYLERKSTQSPPSNTEIFRLVKPYTLTFSAGDVGGDINVPQTIYFDGTGSDFSFASGTWSKNTSSTSFDQTSLIGKNWDINRDSFTYKASTTNTTYQLSFMIDIEYPEGSASNPFSVFLRDEDEEMLICSTGLFLFLEGTKPSTRTVTFVFNPKPGKKYSLMFSYSIPSISEGTVILKLANMKLLLSKI